jgi:tetratricopeptide (TPR) repeat protein
MLDMAEHKAFLMPVILGRVSEAQAVVPERFCERQWSRIESENDLVAFAQRAAAVLRSDLPSLSAPKTSGASSKLFDSQGEGCLTAAVPSIAVLAFANRSASADDEYLSEGLADELINVLAKIRGIRVAARTSAFSFRGKSVTVKEIGLLLNVAKVLEGSVRRSGNRVRVSVQLVNVVDGYHLWSESYDHTLDDIFAVQDDIAQAVLKELSPVLIGQGDVPRDGRFDPGSSAQSAALRSSRTISGEAHGLFLHGRYLIRRQAEKDLEGGVRILRDALSAEPGYPQAWAWLSLALTYGAGHSVFEMQANIEARAAAEKALTLDPECVEAYVAMVTHENWWGWNWDRALAAAETVMQLAPRDVDACVAAAQVYCSLGQHSRAIEYSQRAVEHDPLNPRSFVSLARALRFSGGAHLEVEAALSKVIELSPQALGVQSVLAVTLAEQGKFAEALETAGSEKKAAGRFFAEAVIQHIAGEANRAEKALNGLIELHHHRSSTSSLAVQIAMIYALRGEADLAFHWLDAGFSERDAGISLAKVEPRFRSLHTDPRWSEFMRKMGFED